MSKKKSTNKPEADIEENFRIAVNLSLNKLLRTEDKKRLVAYWDYKLIITVSISDSNAYVFFSEFEFPSSFTSDERAFVHREAKSWVFTQRAERRSRATA